MADLVVVLKRGICQGWKTYTTNYRIAVKAPQHRDFGEISYGNKAQNT